MTQLKHFAELLHSKFNKPLEKSIPVYKNKLFSYFCKLALERVMSYFIIHIDFSIIVTNISLCSNLTNPSILCKNNNSIKNWNKNIFLHRQALTIVLFYPIRPSKSAYCALPLLYRERQASQSTFSQTTTPFIRAKHGVCNYWDSLPYLCFAEIS